jgi:hypothetical protein
MVERTDNVLSYWREPNRLKAFFIVNRRRMIKWGSVIFLLLLGFGVLYGPTSGQIRLDTGDLRYCWWGIPLKYELMPEPQRSKLLALAAKVPPVSAEWVTCVNYPKHYSDNPEIRYHGEYYSIAIWADEDVNIARWAMDDEVKAIPHGGTTRLWPILGYRVLDSSTGKLNVDWRDQEDVKDYCAAHGYVPPPPATRP